MQEVIEYLPFLVPILIIELALALIALVHVLKHPKYHFGNKVMWILIVVFIQILGPIVYFIFGKGEE